MKTKLRTNAFLLEAMDRHGKAVYQIAVSHTSTTADAEDIFQEVYLALLKNTSTFNNDEHLKAWLLRVAINKCRDLNKSATQQRNIPFEESHDVELEPDKPANVWECVASLPPEMREVIHLHYLEGYTTSEIAQIIECSPDAVRTRMHRARKSLKEALMKFQRLQEEISNE